MRAYSVRVRGAVQGVGFRPFVFHLASARALAGWVANREDGVEIHVEGPDAEVRTFLRELQVSPPPAAAISAIDVSPSAPGDLGSFTIRDSASAARPTTRIVPDLAVCDRCVAELFDAADRRFWYPYVNCTACGPRYSVITALPYDRPNTTMRAWALDGDCAAEYHDPADRRFHAQPVACPRCGPAYYLIAGSERVDGSEAAIRRAAREIAGGGIVAVKGIGGYHLACDAADERAVAALRTRKFRREKPFALMVRDLGDARRLVELSPAAETLLCSPARPIVLAPSQCRLPHDLVAPDSGELGIMLPYAPLHYLLFAAGAPAAMVVTSANRSSEPIAYRDADARHELVGLADAFLVGERPIARRLDDSVVRVGAVGPVVLRRARGYAPAPVASLPVTRSVLAVGGDLKNAIALVVEGQAFVSQHIGDLDQASCLEAFRETVADLTAMYGVPVNELLVACDAHPQYRSTLEAAALGAEALRPVQHHRAHVASVVAERGAWDRPILGLACDGTGYGDDGAIWGGELFAGTLVEGFTRAGHLRPAVLPGGDAAAQHPVQAAAGFLSAVDGLPDLCRAPFDFPRRYQDAIRLVERGLRVFPTTSMGRLFDTAAALAGFTRPVTFEGQAAMWLEQRANRGDPADAYPFPFDGRELDFRPLLHAVVSDRSGGRDVPAIARAFHAGVARGLASAATAVCRRRSIATVVVSGGVFQNDLLLRLLRAELADAGLELWANRVVPANDGGLCLGQAALAALGPEGRSS
jgi:hydrogenase maturation protein HypF